MLQRWLGVFDVDARQKWKAVWPRLSTLPLDRFRLLDAGCGSGGWSLELASRRPGWTIVGVDRDGPAVATAEARRRALGLTNVSFLEADFLEFRPAERFDALLSVASAHYLVQANKGRALFGAFASWLEPGGVLVLFGPRRREEMPVTRILPAVHGREIFGYGDLDSLCRESGLVPEVIAPAVGRVGTLAKQVGRIGQDSRWLGRFTYPVQRLLDAFEQGTPVPGDRRSSAWLVVARKPATPGAPGN
ncbi:MAG TPA: class I SAM-dependent methyltransferase [Thermoanaerobaculia bacterium]